MLQNLIHAFKIDPLPPLAQGRFNHHNKIHAHASWEIYDCHLILFIVFKWTQGDVIDPSIS
jgi:hypothetical protein